MMGYYKREKENIIDKDGFLHTGDVAYFDKDGYLFIVDRVKELIKYNGFQVIFRTFYIPFTIACCYL